MGHHPSVPATCPAELPASCGCTPSAWKVRRPKAPYSCVRYLELSRLRSSRWPDFPLAARAASGDLSLCKESRLQDSNLRERSCSPLPCLSVKATRWCQRKESNLTSQRRRVYSPIGVPAPTLTENGCGGSSLYPPRPGRVNFIPSASAANGGEVGSRTLRSCLQGNSASRRTSPCRAISRNRTCAPSVPRTCAATSTMKARPAEAGKVRPTPCERTGTDQSQGRP